MLTPEQVKGKIRKTEEKRVDTIKNYKESFVAYAAFLESI